MRFFRCAGFEFAAWLLTGVAFSAPAHAYRPLKKVQSVEESLPPENRAAGIPPQVVVLLPAEFPLPQPLEPNVRFWITVFTAWRTGQSVLHDPNDLGKVYEVVDLEDHHLLPGDGVKVRAQKTKQRQKILADAKAAIVKKGLAASVRDIREQPGMADRFAGGLKRVGPYLSLMQKIFAERGVPVDLAGLCFVESMFDVSATSKVGAGGPWQIMKYVARRFVGLKVTPQIDERRDPLLATRAAADILRGNYEALGNWPLAVTAYNHGVGGMGNAVKKLSTTDFGKIVQEYRSRTFGFASKNFYAEFLAARYAIANRDKFFPEAYKDEPLELTAKKLDRPILFYQFMIKHDAMHAQMAQLNPALSKDVLKNKKPIPAGSTVFVPARR